MSDLIDRQATLDALADAMPSLTTPDGCGQFDHDIQVTDEAYVDCMRIIHDLPSAQPTGTNTVQVEDCISRAAVVDTIEGVDWYHQNDSGEMVHDANSAEHQAWYKAEDIYKAIEGVPSAQPGWIPVTERLPERYDNYLITTEDEDTDIGTFHPEFKQWSICDADGFRLTDGVLAWCELPKPWEGDDK